MRPRRWVCRLQALRLSSLAAQRRADGETRTDDCCRTRLCRRMDFSFGKHRLSSHARRLRKSCSLMQPQKMYLEWQLLPVIVMKFLLFFDDVSIQGNFGTFARTQKNLPVFVLDNRVLSLNPVRCPKGIKLQCWDIEGLTRASSKVASAVVTHIKPLS